MACDSTEELIMKAFNFNLQIMANLIFNINSQKVMHIRELEILDWAFVVIIKFIIMASKIINTIIAAMQMVIVKVITNTFINHYFEEPNFLIFYSFIKAMRLNFLNN